MMIFKNKKVIVFDLDGTILVLKVNWNQLKKQLANRYVKIYRENCEFVHITACLDRIVEKEDEVELKKFFKIIRDFETKNIRSTEPIEETIFFINNLDLFEVPKETKLAVFSLNTRKAIIKALKLAKIFNKFDFLVGREDVRKWKPNPDGLLKIKEHYMLKIEGLMYIGDQEKDIKTGKNAGIDTHYINELITLVNKKRQEMKIN